MKTEKLEFKDRSHHYPVQMKILGLLSFFLWVPFYIAIGGGAVRTNLFDGVTLYDYPASLDGTLVMMLTRSNRNSNISTTAIYGFDLRRKSLREITRVPQFDPFDVSQDGTLMFVYDSPYGGGRSKVFLYSDRLHLHRDITLSGSLRRFVLCGESAFVVIEDENGDRLYRFDVADDKQTLVKVPDLVVWEKEKYDDVWISTEQTNCICFVYRASRKPTSNFTNRTSGAYSYNLLNGEIKHINGKNPRLFGEQAVDGRYILFEGSGTPVEGRILISSPVDCFNLSLADSRIRNDVRVLHRFPLKLGVENMLIGLSPRKDYAFVRRGELVGRGSGTRVYSYYYTDLSNGKTGLILKDEYKLMTGNEMWLDIIGGR
jgi:hypothetical protein